jgi:hypothetical protein
MPSTSPRAGLLVLLALCLLALVSCGRASVPVLQTPLAAGVVWQPHDGNSNPRGAWDRLGVQNLLVQWSVVDDIAFVADSGLSQTPILPDWPRISREPWAQRVILGLAGRFDETAARNSALDLSILSARLARLPTVLHVEGWYFPVEFDPTWKDASQLRAALANLPRPLWVSVYDNANLGAPNLVSTLAAWLPDDVGILFQDGVGVHARDARTARDYVDTLATRFGAQRVRVIAEVFRPQGGGGFRAATADEILPQLAHYQGLTVYLFDGPTYLSDALVDDLVNRASASP